jgi:hypothetical protein
LNAGDARALSDLWGALSDPLRALKLHSWLKGGLLLWARLDL